MLKYRSGQRNLGRSDCLVPEEKQDDNVHEIMAEHFLQNEELEKAMVHLDHVRNPLPSHYSLRVKVGHYWGQTACPTHRLAAKQPGRLQALRV